MRAVLLLGLLLLGCADAPPAEAPPNIVFIFTDDHTSAALSAYGSTLIETPNMDRLAQEGMLFRHCLVTNSICAPSRAVILTGKYSHLNGQLTNAETFNGNQQTFPKLLQQVGYQTALVGKWHLRSAPTGFDFWRVLIGQGPYYNPPIRSATDTVTVEGYTTDIITDVALDWLADQRTPDQPFLLMYQHKAPHRRWEPGPDHLTRYDDRDMPLPETFWDDYSGRSSAPQTANMRIVDNLTARDLKITPPPNLTEAQRATWDAAYGPKNEALRAEPLTGKPFAEWKYQRYVKDYLRSVKSVDDNIGRLLDYLDASGLSDNTLVVYTSDQGWYLGEHGWYDKRWMYEESLHTPLLVRWPGRVAAGQENTDLVSNVDFAATFLDLAGAPRPADLQGHSLRPLLLGNTPGDWRDSFYYHYYEYPASHCVQRHYGVRTDRHKLIYFYEIDAWELFDLDRDPNELQSVYDDPAYAEVRADLEARLAEHRATLAVPEDTRPSGDCSHDAEGWDGFTE